MAAIVSYDATVVTGLERLAAKECQEKLSVSDIQHSAGHVFIKSQDRYPKLSKLHSVDNLYVIISHDVPLANPTLSQAEPSQLEQMFEQAIDDYDWNLGLQVWMEASGWHKCDLAAMLDRDPGQAHLKPSFRTSCNRSGNHKFTSQSAASIFGGLINDKFHWPVSLKNFDLEILLTVKENALRVALCLSKESLYKRYIVAYGVTSLRGTIAFNLIQIANLAPGDIVCDPLCGSGVIPVETAISWPQTFVLAGDNFEVAIEKSEANCRANNLLCRTSLARWDSTRLPLRDESVDAFITDLPFGKRLGSKHLNRTLYPALFAEMIRCARLATGRIVLLTQDKQNANKCLSSDLVRKYCKHEKSFYVNVGGLDSSIYLLKRNVTPFANIKH